MFGKKKKVLEYDKTQLKPALRCSICTGEQVAGFRNIHTGRFQEVMLIRTQADMQEFMDSYGLTEVETIY